jgi:ADP-heptose:LPS heptosyltransferase
MFFYKLLLISLIKFRKYVSKSRLLDTKALFISNAGIGDTIYLLSAIQYYKQLTGINANILITQSSKDLFFNCDYVNNIFILNDNQQIDFAQYNYIFSNRTDISILYAIIKTGFSGRFIENPNYEELRLISRIRCLISQKYKKKYFSKFHAGLQFNYILRDIFKAKLIFPKPVIKSRKPHFDEIDKFLKENLRYGILHVAGQDEIRKLNPNLIYNITKSLNFPIILVGSKDDLKSFTRIRFSSRVYNGIGKFNLNEVFYLLENSTFCIAPDSSIMHLASLTNTYLVGIMGNALEETFGPIFSTNNIILSKNPICSPCSKNICKKYNGYSCVQNITTIEIVDAVYKNLKL